MIGYLQGEVIEKSRGELWINVGGVGYRVAVGVDILNKMTLGEKIQIYTYTSVKENAIELYGFESMRALRMFEMMLSVSGVGPKIGLAILGSRSVDRVERAVSEADISFFQAVPGIGKKGAQRIIVDLKGKMKSLKEVDLTGEVEEDEVMSALVQFGFGRVEVMRVLQDVDRDLPEGERIKLGLKLLGKRRG